MKILVYTRGVPTEGGGGRRVSMELLSNFNKLGVTAYSWSILPLNPASLYNGKYRFESDYFFDDWSVNVEELDYWIRRKICLHFLAAIEREKPSHILFDTEYSFREFVHLTSNILDRKRLPPMAVLVHDQIWKNDITYLSAFTSSTEAFTVERDCPYPDLMGYVTAVGSAIGESVCCNASATSGTRQKKESMQAVSISSSEQSRGLLRKLSGAMGFSGISLSAEARSIRKIKHDLQEARILFCLTERSAKESAMAYSFAISNVVSASGFYDPDDVVSLCDKSFRANFSTGNKKVVLAFSRISEEKNIELILFAFSQAYMHSPEMQLWVAGLVTEEKNAYFYSLKELSRKLGVDEAVFFVGTVSDGEMNRLYAEADAFICAQIADFNISVYYAMRFSLPVIVSSSYDFPVILKKSEAIFSDNHTIEDFAESILIATCKCPSYNKPEHEYISSLTFEHYAKEVISALSEISSWPGRMN